MRSRVGTFGRSGSSIGPFHPAPLTGVISDRPAPATPGTAAAASRIRSNSASRASGPTAAARGVDVHDQDRVAIETDVERRELAERAHEQAGGDHQDERERDLDDQQRRAEHPPAFAGKRPRLLLERFDADRRGGCAAPARCRTAAPSPTATSAVNPTTRQSSARSSTTVLRGVESWPTIRRLPHCANTRPSAAPSHGEQQAFDQQLPGDAEARGAERQPHA